MNTLTSNATQIAAWFQSPAGQYFHTIESAMHDRLVADIFGYYALQIGCPSLDALKASRINHRWCMAEEESKIARTPFLLGHFSDLPFPDESIDLVVLPHTLELCREPHRLLREVGRILVPQGRVVISGFNPNSAFALKRLWQMRFSPALSASEQALPFGVTPLSISRLRDWLSLLDLRCRSSAMAGYRFPRSAARQVWRNKQTPSIEAMGNRWWPMFGSVYCLEAVKEIRSMRLVGLIKEKRAFSPQQQVGVNTINAEKH